MMQLAGIMLELGTGVVMLASSAQGSEAEKPIGGHPDERQAQRTWHVQEEELPIKVRFALTQIYQHNVRGGLSTEADSGQYTASYDVESTIDLDALAAIPHSRFYFLAEGGWPESGGIDSEAVGSYFGVNGDAIEGHWGQLSELWFERSFMFDHWLIRLGKVDLTGGFEYRDYELAFDCTPYANDETSQFLNGALINNPTIPFPDRTLALAAFGNPRPDWYIGLGLAARDSENGGDEDISWGSVDDGLFFVAEGSFMPTQTVQDVRCRAAYRAGLWCSTSGDETFSDSEQYGTYLTVTQPLTRTDATTPEYGLSLFARAGWAAGGQAKVATFWSIGLHQQGLLTSDGSDVLGLGVAQGIFAGDVAPESPGGQETAIELYYSTPVTSWARLSPGFQYIIDPGGDTGSDDALVAGVRLHITLE